ncbi:MAG: sigma-70 family RNA polymerase sigma factor [Lutibacter sp.]|jgi:RNA polymerase sigma factor (sigma-70 family)
MSKNPGIDKLCNHQILTVEEERELAVKANTGDIEARNKLIKCNIKLVVSAAKKYFYRTDYEDLIITGILGLIHAIEKFDATRDVRLSTYATFWIDDYLKRAALNESRTIAIPFRSRDVQINILSLDDIGQDSKFTETIIDDSAKNPSETLEVESDIKFAKSLIEDLKTEEQKVILMYLDDYSITSIKETLGYKNREAVRRVILRAIEKCRKKVSLNFINEYKIRSNKND